MIVTQLFSSCIQVFPNRRLSNDILKFYSAARRTVASLTKSVITLWQTVFVILLMPVKIQVAVRGGVENCRKANMELDNSAQSHGCCILIGQLKRKPLEN